MSAALSLLGTALQCTERQHSHRFFPRVFTSVPSRFAAHLWTVNVNCPLPDAQRFWKAPLNALECRRTHDVQSKACIAVDDVGCAGLCAPDTDAVHRNSGFHTDHILWNFEW